MASPSHGELLHDEEFSSVPFVYREQILTADELAYLLDRFNRKATSGRVLASTVYNGESEVVSTTRKSWQTTGNDPKTFDVIARALKRTKAIPPCLRVLRTHFDILCYGATDYFSVHKDFEVLQGEDLEMLTGIICLSSALSGGELCIYREKPDDSNNAAASSSSQEAAAMVRVAYATNSLCLFPARSYHESTVVRSGVKYVLKFDVISTERLYWLGSSQPEERGGGGDSSCDIIAASGLHECSLLHGKQRFLGLSRRDGREDGKPADDDATLAVARRSCLQLDPGDITLLARFHAGECISEEELQQLRFLLNFTCAAEDALNDEQLRSFMKNGYALVEPAFSFSSILNVEQLIPIFFACSHDENTQLGGTMSSFPRAWIAADFGGSLASGSAAQAEGCWYRRPPRPSCGKLVEEAAAAGGGRGDRHLLWRKVVAALVAHEVDMLEIDAWQYDSKEYDLPRVILNDEATCSSPLLPDGFFPSGGSEKTTAPDGNHSLKLSVLPVAELIMATLFGSGTVAATVSQGFADVDDCNDGHSYSVRHYCTTTIRRSFCVLARVYDSTEDVHHLSLSGIV